MGCLGNPHPGRVRMLGLAMLGKAFGQDECPTTVGMGWMENNIESRSNKMCCIYYDLFSLENI